MKRYLLVGFLPVFFWLPALPGQPALPKDDGKLKSIEAAPARDLARFSDKQKFYYLSGQRCLEWLQKANKPDGRFVYGFLPALSVPLDGDNYIHQVGAAMALARAAKFYRDERGSATAKQAFLTLLLETTADPKQGLRYSAASPKLLDRPSASAMLALAIHELASPATDLLDQADQLANYLHTLVQADGSLKLCEEDKQSKVNDQAIQHVSGLVLYAIARSQAMRPADWKVEALRKARPVYMAYWNQNKNMPMIPGHTAAYTEAYLHTKDQAFADAVFEMNDWLCELQYQGRGKWHGGFQHWVEGRAVQSMPDQDSAQYAESLAEACRVAKAAGDVQRFQRYQQALELTLRFLTSMQYSDTSVRHFADWFRPAVVGGFHSSPQDGNLRIDYSQHALCGIVQYLNYVAELP